LKDNIILVDCDGVLLDWWPYFEQWMDEKHNLKPKNKELYNIGKIYEIPGMEAKRYVGKFNESTHMANLGPLRDAVKYVRKLYVEYGFRFHVITSQTTNKSAQEFRKYNLETLFGKEVFHGFTILEQGADKDKELTKWKDSECWWVEDKIENVIHGWEAGLNSLLMGHVYNKDGHSNEWYYCTNWKEVYNKITGG